MFNAKTTLINIQKDLCAKRQNMGLLKSIKIFENTKNKSVKYYQSF